MFVHYPECSRNGHSGGGVSKLDLLRGETFEVDERTSDLAWLLIFDGLLANLLEQGHPSGDSFIHFFT